MERGALVAGKTARDHQERHQLVSGAKCSTNACMFNTVCQYAPICQPSYALSSLLKRSRCVLERSAAAVASQLPVHDTCQLPRRSPAPACQLLNDSNACYLLSYPTTPRRALQARSVTRVRAPRQRAECGDAAAHARAAPCAHHACWKPRALKTVPRSSRALEAVNVAARPLRVRKDLGDRRQVIRIEV